MKVSGYSDGSYSIEGALALTIFTVCMMALMSILSVMKVEGEVQDALNETALELSQYSYVLGRTEFIKEAVEEHAEGLGMLLSLDENGSSDLAFAGPAAAKLLTKENFNRDHVDRWLKDQGVRDGYSGLSFKDTQVLMDGKTITVAVIYDLSVNTYGLFEKTLTIREAAVTYGLLPTDSALKKAGSEKTNSSIWQETNFVRGKYFAEKIRASGGTGLAAKTGQGIDLYDPVTGTYTEVYSMNVFLPTYSNLSSNTASGESSASAADFSPRADSIEKSVLGYARDMEKDISQLGKEVTLADGSTEAVVPAKQKVLVLIVPEETKENKAMQTALSAASVSAQNKYGITVKLQYEQKALVQTQTGEEE